MWNLQKPTPSGVSEILEKEKESKLSYERVKGTLDHRLKDDFLKDPRYKGFDVDQHILLLGKGEEIFEKAKEALKSWKQFDMEWVI
jgi:uncharacterized protein (UPF0548 family)